MRSIAIAQIYFAEYGTNARIRNVYLRQVVQEARRQDSALCHR